MLKNQESGPQVRQLEANWGADHMRTYTGKLTICRPYLAGGAEEVIWDQNWKTKQNL
jgi:hypothetical protein